MFWEPEDGRRGAERWGLEASLGRIRRRASYPAPSAEFLGLDICRRFLYLYFDNLHRGE